MFNEVFASLLLTLISTAQPDAIVPSIPPSSVSVTDVTAFTITVQWRKVPCNAQNGIIKNYTVWYNWDTESDNSMAKSSQMTANLGNRSVCNKEGSTMDNNALDSGQEGVNRRVVNVSASEQQVTLTGLRPSTNYSITVAAYNSVGIGQQSQPVFVNTKSE